MGPQQSDPVPHPRPLGESEQARVLNLLAVPLSRWRIVAGVIGVAVILAIVWLVIRPERKVATIVLMPSPEVDATRSLSQLLTQELALDLGGLVPINREISAIA